MSDNYFPVKLEIAPDTPKEKVQIYQSIADKRNFLEKQKAVKLKALEKQITAVYDEYVAGVDALKAEMTRRLAEYERRVGV